ncbi:hypothetical protein [Asticcacaulis sp. EMRT-3]|uniref:hypothetical protein n=1 Tax=Asticcacaulis sp. EMRT-3 TaxID=3040349 RepID=UPI0024AFF7B7|nr:hypothetical protein [Asticcacaulis sp. EMRT-3]MDI7776514.1 hypothetical protein [Asticcacaulis sp. EMRT-3]
MKSFIRSTRSQNPEVGYAGENLQQRHLACEMLERLGKREPGIGMAEDVKAWASSILKIAYDRDLSIDEHAELVNHLAAYVDEAQGFGIDSEIAKTTLMNEVLDIAPIIEPLARVLKRVLRAQKSR